MKKVVYGIPQTRYGCVDTMMHLFTDFDFNNTPIVEKGILEEEIKNLVQQFFKEMRLLKKNIID
jgi:tRNA(adenine34) deaminase